MHCRSLTQEALNTHGARALRILTEYWQALPGGHGLPHWNSVDPGAIQDALEYAFLADRLGQRHARFRVAGGAVSGLIGRDLAGLLLSVLVHPGSRAGFDAALADSFAHRSGLDLTLGTSGPDHRPQVTARMVLFPLRDDAGRVTRVLGGLAAGGATGPAPCRFVLKDAPRDITRRAVPAPIMPGSGRLRLVVNNA